MSTGSRIKNTLPLSHFIRRQKTLSLYRAFFRLTRRLEDSSEREEIRHWVRSEFKLHKNVTDPELIEMNLTRAKEALRNLETSLRFSHALK